MIAVPFHTFTIASAWGDLVRFFRRHWEHWVGTLERTHSGEPRHEKTRMGGRWIVKLGSESEAETVGVLFNS